MRWDGSDVGYAYDSMGQLTGAVGRHGSTNRIHEQFTYSYDAGGNLSTRVNNDLKEWFTVDSLNQLTEVLRTNSMTVAGTTSTNASSVAINGSTAGVNLYADATFAKAGLSLSNGTNTFTAVAQDALGRSDTNSVSVWMPTTRALGYDNNGNLISDGLRGFEYDDENQLIRITVTNAWMTEFVYDGMRRCRVRREKTWVSGAWQTASETRYVYHGRLVMQERDGNNQPRITYTRGPDLSGSLAGAGGIGGLLARTENPPLLAGRTNSHTFYHADAGGNITAMTDGTQGVAARYLYDPYGNTISRSGPLAEVNVYRFSSKELHSASGLYYYGFRFYDPSLQRWPNRDPIQELGGINLNQAFRNNPLNKYDPLGLLSNEDCENDLRKEMVEISKIGAGCYVDFFIGGMIDAAAGLVVGGVGVIIVPGVGVIAGVVVGGAMGIKDFWDLRQCMNEMEAQAKEAKRRYEQCRKACERKGK